MATGCCDNPDPRILEKNGRLFCHNCRRYLSKPTQQDEPPEYVPPKSDDETEEETAK